MAHDVRNRLVEGAEHRVSGIVDTGEITGHPAGKGAGTALKPFFRGYDALQFFQKPQATIECFIVNGVKADCVNRNIHTTIEWHGCRQGFIGFDQL